MREVAIIGVGMTKFGKFLDKTIKELTRDACWMAVKDANINPREIGIAYFANSFGGRLWGQDSVRGQVALREIGIGGIPIINVENACAGGSTAFFEAWMAVGSGLFDVALAIGAEKLFCGETARSLDALSRVSDVEMEGQMGFNMPAIYAMRMRKHMAAFGTTRRQMALVSVKNHKNGCLNPYAQYQQEVTVEEVLNSRMIVDPITLLMAAPLGDGAAASVICSKEMAHKYTNRLVIVAASVVTSAEIKDIRVSDSANGVEKAAKSAYEMSGIGPGDIDVAEVHDAMAPAEILHYENLGFCREGEGGILVEQGETEIQGRIPVNTSGGLAAKGHPVAATGLAQIAEIVWQLRGEAGKRQVNRPQVGLIENGGGNVGGETAAVSIQILKK